MAARTSACHTEKIDISRDPARALGRVLAEHIVADRDDPAFNRSTRDGFAVRSAEAAPGARLRLIGESCAGVAFVGSVGAGECVRILTGAPVPRGADAVVMQEYAHTDGDFVVIEQAAQQGQNFILAGEHARTGETVVARGARLGYAELAMAAGVGRACVEVFRRPRVAILSCGDELVPIGCAAEPFEIRNTNSISLAAQVTLAGGEPAMCGIARDAVDELRARVEQGLEADMLVLSGGVAVGKYDLAEQALRALGAEFFFDAVAIRPGKPAVFGWCRGKPVFGLPGNPVSTMVTFELFVAPAIGALSGRMPGPLPLFQAKLAHPINEKAPLTHFIPARVSWRTVTSEANAGDNSASEIPSTPIVEAVPWEGSGDIGAVVRANCFLVVYASRLHLERGEWVDVLPQRGKF